MENKTPIGSIFGTIAIYEEKQVSQLIDTMEFEQAYFYITQALQHSFNSGVYSLQESEILSKSLRILSSKISETK